MNVNLENLNFARDRRNCAAATPPVLYVTHADGEIEEVPLPTKWGVCPVCNGVGTHVNPAIDCNGLSAEDFDEDPGFAEDYCNGTYDVQCNLCRGRTTVQEVDWDRLTSAQAAAYRKQLQDEADTQAEYFAEIRAGA